MKINDVLNEATSDVVYHFTDARKATLILRNDMFQLMPTFKNNSEENMNDRLFFLSLTRSRRGSYHQGSMSGVLFKLDGRKLNQNYRIKPVDYWHTPDGGLSKANDEMEDRLYSDKNKIPALKYVTEITVLIDKSSFERPSKFDAWYKDLYAFAKRNNLPIFMYTDKEAFMLDKKSSAVSFDELKPMFAGAVAARQKAGPDYARGRKRLYDLQTLIHVLYKQDDISKMNHKESSMAKDMTYDYKRAANSLGSDLHNNADTNAVYVVSKFMKKFKVKRFDDLIKILSEKFTKQFNEREQQQKLERAKKRYAANREFYDHVNDVAARKEKYDASKFGKDQYQIFDAVEDLYFLSKLKDESLIDRGYADRYGIIVRFDI